MKNILLLSVICLSSYLSFSQVPDSTKNIFGTWKISEKSIEPLSQVQLEQLKKANPSLADQINIETIKEGLKQATYVYNADGTYLFKSSGQQDAGKWKLADDKKSIICKNDASGRETIRVIIAVSAKRVMLKLTNGVTVTYDPVK